MSITYLSRRSSFHKSGDCGQWRSHWYLITSDLFFVAIEEVMSQLLRNPMFWRPAQTWASDPALPVAELKRTWWGGVFVDFSGNTFLILISTSNLYHKLNVLFYFLSACFLNFFWWVKSWFKLYRSIWPQSDKASLGTLLFHPNLRVSGEMHACIMSIFFWRHFVSQYATSIFQALEWSLERLSMLPGWQPVVST